MTLFTRFRHLLSNKLYPHAPLVTVGISKRALLHNFRTYQEAYPGLLLAPVLKSNAYGHDLGLVARVLDAEPIAFFMVDSLYEAKRLREAGIRSRIVVMGYVRAEDIARSRLARTDYAVTDIEQLRTLASLATRSLRIHLKLDTGMHRQGIMPEDLDEAIVLITENPALELVGIGSHFADADTDGSLHTKLQLERWHAMRVRLESAFPAIAYTHLAATKGARYAADAGTNVIRLGIGLYGFDTAPGGSGARSPVMELRSIIGSIREVPAGEHIGYNATYETTAARTIATVPAGYFEGVDRRLSNKGVVLVSGHACPVIGRVSMNMMSIDITEVPDAKRGDAVVLISRDLREPNAVPALAELVSSPEYRETPYLIPTHVPQHLKRVLE